MVLSEGEEVECDEGKSRKQTEGTEDIYDGAGSACLETMSMNHSSCHCCCPWQPAATGKQSGNRVMGGSHWRLAAGGFSATASGNRADLPTESPVFTQALEIFS